MNNLVKRATLIIATAATLGSSCKKENNITANPPTTAAGSEVSADYRPVILGSITAPRGIYSRDSLSSDFGPYFDARQLSSVPMADLGSITVVVNYRKTFVYRLTDGDEVLAKFKPPFSSGIGYNSSFFNAEVTIIGVDKEQNSQITIGLSFLQIYNVYVIREVSFKFDGRDTPGNASSVVEYNSYFSTLGTAASPLQVEQKGAQIKAKGTFYSGIGYRAGIWTNRSPFVVSGSFNIEPPKM